MQYSKGIDTATSKENIFFFFIQTTFLVQPPSLSTVAGEKDSSYFSLDEEEPLQIRVFASL